MPYERLSPKSIITRLLTSERFDPFHLAAYGTMKSEKGQVLLDPAR
jgi:hypothetical protein